MINPSPPAASAAEQDPLLAATVRLLRHRRRWVWTTIGGFMAFLVVISVYSNQYSDATNSGPVAVLAVAMAIAALTITGLVMAVVASVVLGRRTAAQRAQAVSYADRQAAARSRKGRYDWALASGLLVVALGLAVLFLPGLVNGVSYLAGGSTATFVPQSYAESCSYHGNGDCSTVTIGILKTGGAGVRSTWPHEVPLGRSFQVRKPVWPWGPGSGLIDGDGIAVGAALISLLFVGLTVPAGIFFVNEVRGKHKRAAPAVGHS
ncbi:MAG TPA: hypothetical protein VH637_25850 [Streptosporangiaceae bacterium]